MLVLFETAAGFAIFKVRDEKKLQNVENLFENFEDAGKASKFVQLQHFKKFADSAEALQAGVAVNEGKMCKPLKKLLKKVYAEEAHEQLLVLDAKLGGTIKDKLNIDVVHNNAVGELMRCIKSQVDSLIPGLQAKELSAMSLGLAHNLSRYKLKFSPDKVDTMIVQAVSLLDDIDKELNNYVMRTREWYGWHFPELTKILTDNTQYIKTVTLMGTRENAKNTDFSEILSEELEMRVKEAAEISMGTEISDEDMMNINMLCTQIADLQEYRTQLFEYLQNRMQAIAPNLTIMVGELVGARLVAHAGSLLNLAKHPASTIQILGAEKALFRALKTRHATPKYGLIYHAQLVSQTGMKNKGKMSRMLAAKTALACRYDALGEETTTEMGVNNRAKLHSRIQMLENGHMGRISGTGKTQAKFEKYQGVQDVKQYQTAQDSTMESSSRIKIEADAEAATPDAGKKSKKRKREEQQAEEETPVIASPKKKKHKKVKQEPQDVKQEALDQTLGDLEDLPIPELKTEPADESAATPSAEKKKKKKKKKSHDDE